MEAVFSYQDRLSPPLLGKAASRSTVSGIELMKYTQKEAAECQENLENYKANYEALETKLADALKRYDEQRNAKKAVLEREYNYRKSQELAV